MDPRDLLLALLARLPLAFADAGSWLLAWTWWWVLPVRRRVAVENLARALPEAPPRRTLTRMFHDIALGYVELLHYDRGGNVRVEVDAAEVPPGSILLSGHGGSWDLALVASAEVLPIVIFLRTPANPWVRTRLAGLRERHGVGALETGTRMDAAYDALSQGRSVYFVQDQHFANGLPSVFFGRPARTSAGLAAAVLRTGRPVFAAWPVRLGRGRHQLRFERLDLPTPTGDRAVDAQAITDATNRWYEARIRERPHGWLWLHRRWK
jgi:KDO2-lipid IV(A) lauroyltransferase